MTEYMAQMKKKLSAMATMANSDIAAASSVG
jgi:hypothetical protein